MYKVLLYRQDKPGEFVTDISVIPQVGFMTICTHWSVDEVSSVNLMFRYVKVNPSDERGVDFNIEIEPFNPNLN